MSTRRRPLTAEEWRAIADHCRESVAILLRVGAAMEWVRGRGELINALGLLRDRIDWEVDTELAPIASDQLGIGLGEARGMFEPPSVIGKGSDDPLRLTYGWERPDVPLTRAEWTTIGDDMKRLHCLVMAIEEALQPATSEAERRRWGVFHDKVRSFKCRMDGLVCGGHRGWPEATRVFFGPPSEANPPLLASIGMKPARS